MDELSPESKDLLEHFREGVNPDLDDGRVIRRQRDHLSDLLHTHHGGRPRPSGSAPCELLRRSL